MRHCSDVCFYVVGAHVHLHPNICSTFRGPRCFGSGSIV